MINVFLGYLLLGAFAVGFARAGCAEDLSQDQQYMTCAKHFFTRLEHNPEDITEIVCSPEGQENMQCLLNYVKQCPAIGLPENNPVLGSILQQISNFKEFKDLCRQATGECSQVTQCIEDNMKDFSLGETTDDYSTPPKTPFENFQATLTILCGPVKAIFACLEQHKDVCPDMVDAMKTEIRQSVEANSIGLNPDLNYLMNFLTNECPREAENFNQNSCVRTQISSDEFVTCYLEVLESFRTEQERGSCPAYFAVKKCIENTVGKCGAEEKKLMLAASRLFTPGLLTNCTQPLVQDEDGERGGKRGMQSSLVILLSIMAIYFALIKN